MICLLSVFSVKHAAKYLCCNALMYRCVEEERNTLHLSVRVHSSLSLLNSGLDGGTNTDVGLTADKTKNEAAYF